ncbi:uncharacterized protein EI90DRAFT_3029304 [Cantharellus anzutake]|uniref:uncharacterized protein n=1 Tax=Cantharellus anzutake TaxID=1750568 RepID=UPI0019060D68|nr:uncharacterized protein EI90DRAFT_3029304 [Cantharellus anzutake]KAF8344329.1 hypothetical protein EI90DRAFT_3029304 [Cantharellus anzutake]
MNPPAHPNRRYPNPFLLLSIPFLSFAAFAAVVKYRESTNPASKRPRQHPNPLIPPVQKEQ